MLTGKKNRLLILVSALFSLVLSMLTCSLSYADSVEITESQINKKLNETFPIERQFEGVKAFFTKPKVLLDPLDETLTLGVLIRASQGDKTLVAIGEIEGAMEYDEAFKVMQMRKPVLEEFNVKETDMSEEQAKSVTRIIRQSMGNNLPKVVLIDFNDFDLRFPRTSPKEVDIEQGRITIEL